MLEITDELEITPKAPVHTLHARAHVHMDGRMCAWTHGCMDARTHSRAHTHIRVRTCRRSVLKARSRRLRSWILMLVRTGHVHSYVYRRVHRRACVHTCQNPSAARVCWPCARAHPRVRVPARVSACVRVRGAYECVHPTVHAPFCSHHTCSYADPAHMQTRMMCSCMI